MIDTMLRELETALAQGMTRDEARLRAEVAVRREYAGERVYVAALPAQARSVQLAELGKRRQIDLALATGLTVRRVRQIQRGR
jgi:hypothetical protein